MDIYVDTIRLGNFHPHKGLRTLRGIFAGLPTEYFTYMEASADQVSFTDDFTVMQPRISIMPIVHREPVIRYTTFKPNEIVRIALRAKQSYGHPRELAATLNDHLDPSVAMRATTSREGATLIGRSFVGLRRERQLQYTS